MEIQISDQDHLCRACVAAERFEGGLRFALNRDSKVMQGKNARKVRRGGCFCGMMRRRERRGQGACNQARACLASPSPRAGRLPRNTPLLLRCHHVSRPGPIRVTWPRQLWNRESRSPACGRKKRESEGRGDVESGHGLGAYTVWKKCVCFITAGPITKLCAWGEEESGGHVL